MTFKCTVYYNCFDLVDFHGWEKGEEFIKVLCHNAMQKLLNNMFTPEFGRFSFHNQNIITGKCAYHASMNS